VQSTETAILRIKHRRAGDEAGSDDARRGQFERLMSEGDLPGLSGGSKPQSEDRSIQLGALMLVSKVDKK